MILVTSNKTFFQNRAQPGIQPNRSEAKDLVSQLKKQQKLTSILSGESDNPAIQFSYPSCAALSKTLNQNRRTKLLKEISLTPSFFGRTLPI